MRGVLGSGLRMSALSSEHGHLDEYVVDPCVQGLRLQVTESLASN